jgi:uncharacterized membrane protein
MPGEQNIAGSSRHSTGPTVPPPNAHDLSTVLNRNIQSIQERRRKEEKGASTQERLAEAVTHFTGSMAFVYIHLVGFGLWIACNVGWIPALRPWDPTFVILATEASVEAIFLSTFVLISQNRATAAADKRADLDLQINLLAEHEITRLLNLTTLIAGKVGVELSAQAAELQELQRDVAPEAVLDKIEDESTPSPST